ncbi:hypothetical protein ElyMa_005091300 [Elysia marginata]|uniref:Uncharacterized protein n=1 Tax=Elysia marginata TaxID=1093978 RepID=A0AAV4JJ33_9GAST|nr:hypothetical protein ElyMa_005091300 [Elysia marginata]
MTVGTERNAMRDLVVPKSNLMVPLRQRRSLINSTPSRTKKAPPTPTAGQQNKCKHTRKKNPAGLCATDSPSSRRGDKLSKQQPDIVLFALLTLIIYVS